MIIMKAALFTVISRSRSRFVGAFLFSGLYDMR